MSIKNIRTFIDTRKRFKQDESLLNLTKQAVENTVLYRENFSAGKTKSGSPAIIYCQEESTLTVAEKLKDKYVRVAVLNFANATTPGGGVIFGANAQEEYLCRNGNLYACLTKRGLYKSFYLYHILRFSTYYSDRIVYSKDVSFFGERGLFQADVITSPAPNITFMISPSEKKVSRVIESRVRNIFETAIDNQAESLVLGAFGCGAFGNKPEIVAEVFRKILRDEHYENYFKEIVFERIFGKTTEV
ncbi:MAG: TIGR02452 family protein [Oscillospiraceae bacterium]|nr:TIGR02452 family protein [Oscillospiraceae bacterium]